MDDTNTVPCIVCGEPTQPEEDLCFECDNFRVLLEHYATSACRRSLITGTLLYHRFNIVDQDEDHACPIQCGYCCQTSWSTVLSLRYKFGEAQDGVPCPHLKEDGCELPRETRPNGCVAFLCPLAWHVKAGRMSVEEALALLLKHKGDSRWASASLSKRQIVEKRKDC